MGHLVFQINNIDIVDLNTITHLAVIPGLTVQQQRANGALAEDGGPV